MQGASPSAATGRSRPCVGSYLGLLLLPLLVFGFAAAGWRCCYRRVSTVIIILHSCKFGTAGSEECHWQANIRSQAVPLQ